MSSSTLATAYTAVDSTRRSLAPMSVSTQPVEVPKPAGWPDPVKDYVRRSFAPENLIEGISRPDMETQLKATITQAAESGQLLSTDWAKYPLPQQMIQQARAAFFATQHHAQFHWNQAHPIPLPTTSSPYQISPPVPMNGKKRPFDDQSNSSGSTTPPWRKTAKANTFEDRITYPSKNQSRLDKKLKKAQTMEPSSKFQENLESRRRRFNLDQNSNGNSGSRSTEDENSVPTGPIVGTSQEIFKGYFRLTRAPRPAEVRPQSVLEEALKRLKQQWRQDSNYNFVCDQLKSIRQDLTVQHIKNAFTVEVYQTHALIALEKGDMGEYNQCQTQLKGLYAQKLGGRPQEFTAYRILYFIHTSNRAGLNEILAELTPVDKKAEEIRHALSVRSAVASGNYHRLFRLYSDCSYMGAYLMDKFVDRERVQALAKICKAYRGQMLSIKFLSEELGFDSYEDAAQFLVNHGCQEQKFLIETSNDLVLDTKAAALFEQKRQELFRIIDIKGQI